MPHAAFLSMGERYVLSPPQGQKVRELGVHVREKENLTELQFPALLTNYSSQDAMCGGEYASNVSHLHNQR